MNDFVDSLLTLLLTDFPQQTKLFSIMTLTIQKTASSTCYSPKIEKLPSEILAIIFSHLDQLGAVIQTCKAFKNAYFSSVKLRTIHALAYARHLGAADYFSVWFEDNDRFEELIKHCDTVGFRLAFRKIMTDVLDKGNPYDALKLAKLAARLNIDKTTIFKCFEVAEKSFLEQAQQNKLHKPHLLLVDVVLIANDLEFAASFVKKHHGITNDLEATHAMLAEASIALAKEKQGFESKVYFAGCWDFCNKAVEVPDPIFSAMWLKTIEVLAWQNPTQAQNVNQQLPQSRTNSIQAYRIVMRLAETGKIEDAIKYYPQIQLYGLTVVKMQACLSIAFALFEDRQLDVARKYLEEGANIEKQFSIFELTLVDYLGRLFRDGRYEAVEIFISVCPASQLDMAWACCAQHRVRHRFSAEKIHEAIEKISGEIEKESTLFKCIDLIQKNEGEGERAAYFYSLLIKREGLSIPQLARVIALEFKLNKIDEGGKRALEACEAIKKKGLMSTYPRESIDIVKYLFLSPQKEMYRDFIEELKQKNSGHAYFSDMLKHLCQEQAKIGDKTGYQKTLETIEKLCKEEEGYYSLLPDVLGLGGDFSKVKGAIEKICNLPPGSHIFQQTMHMRNYRSNWK